jgi:hypothetical protein
LADHGRRRFSFVVVGEWILLASDRSSC